MAPTLEKNKNRIFGLDFLRVFSIALVLCSHSSWIYPPSSSIFSKMVDMCGFFGVELFFVLSGFLIGGNLYKLVLRPDFNLQLARNFLNRRMLRIVPNYYLVILINIFVGYYIGYSIKDAWKYFFFFQNFSEPLLPFFPESWSMPIKEFTYLFLILLLWLGVRFIPNINRKQLFLCTVFGLGFIFFITKIDYHLHTHNTTMLQWDISLRSVVIYRIDTVLCGVLLGCLAIEFPGFLNTYKWHFAVLGIFILLGLVIGMYFFKLNIINYPWFWNILCLPINGVGLCCFIPLFSMWKSGPQYIDRIVTYISEISYGIYLVHYSLVLFLMKTLFPTEGLPIIYLHFYTFCYISITFILSTLLYYFFENPINKLRK